MSTTHARRWRRANGLKLVNSETLAVSRAVLRGLGFDPDTHDINPTRGGGVKIDKGGKVVKQLTKAQLDAELADPRTTIAIQTFLPRERNYIEGQQLEKANWGEEDEPVTGQPCPVDGYHREPSPGRDDQPRVRSPGDC